MEVARFPEPFRSDIQSAVSILSSLGARRVYIFGSLVETDRAANANDIDIAVEGLPPEHFFRAYGQLMMKLDHQFDLVDLSNGSAFVRRLRESGALEQVA